jgi:hypothetical protein
MIPAVVVLINESFNAFSLLFRSEVLLKLNYILHGAVISINLSLSLGIPWDI